MQQVNKASNNVDIDDLKSKINEADAKVVQTIADLKRAIKDAPDWDRIEYRCGKHPYYWDKIENRCGMCTDDITNKLSKILSRK